MYTHIYTNRGQFPLIQLTEIDETTTSLLLSYLGFSRYAQLLLDSGVNGSDLANSKEEDLESLGIGFRPHRTRLIKAVKAVRHSGVELSKLGKLEELQSMVR